jgi:hypothetical protein
MPGFWLQKGSNIRYAEGGTKFFADMHIPVQIHRSDNTKVIIKVISKPW